VTPIVTIRGEHYIPLPDVAATFEIELTWVQEVYEFGLLGPGETVGGTVAIASRLLDRVAAIRRLNRVQGVNLAGIAVILPADPAEGAP
jgi:hypothetical protein